jgi:hypothetical protein
MATLFMIAASIVTIGWLWFYVARPILEDFGIIRVDDAAESVNHSQDVMSHPATPAPAQTTDRQADRPSVSADDLSAPRLQLDRTKQALIEVMVYNGWGAGEIRAVIKGDNGVIGAEVDAARKKLGIEPPDRVIRVRDEKGERVIPI